MSDGTNDGWIKARFFKAGAVDAAALGAGSVIASKLATDAVETTKIKNLNVTTGKLADLAVTTGKIADLGVTTGKIAGDAITGAKIADGAVDTEHLAGDAVTPDKIDGFTYFVYEQDFPLASSGTLPAPLAKDLHATTTGDYADDTVGGVYRLATSAVAEAQAAQLTFGDQLIINPDGCVFEARFRVNTDGAAPVAGERWVAGLCSVHTNAEDSLDATTYNMWVRGEGIDLKLYIEGDDNVVNTDDEDSLEVYADNTWITIKIDATDISQVWFSINGTRVGDIAMSNITSANVLQPIFCYQRDGADLTVNRFDIDYVRVYCPRA